MTEYVHDLCIPDWYTPHTDTAFRLGQLRDLGIVSVGWRVSGQNGYCQQGLAERAMLVIGFHGE
jgi:hypothetical protein